MSDARVIVRFDVYYDKSVATTPFFSDMTIVITSGFYVSYKNPFLNN